MAQTATKEKQTASDTFFNANFFTVKLFPFLFGLTMTINWLLFWSIPIMGMGALWKEVLKPHLQPMYDSIEKNPSIRAFAAKYIYSKPEHADFFPMSVFVIVNSTFFLTIVFHYQMNYGYLPAWLIFIYYCSWVGLGGRIMGAAYALAHKEGHNKGMYKKWIKESVGNVFENWIGVVFGNVPWNFTTSHISVHHKLNAACGDTFYMWDIDRTSVLDFLLYVHRIFLHMTGWSSYKFFLAHGLRDKADTLQRGMMNYWLTGLLFLLLTRSFSFVFWIYIQPLLCMTYFLALINVGFHCFIEFDEKGKSISSVNSTAIIDGDDDNFGEDDHMAHHYAASVYYRDLPTYRVTKVDEFKKTHASVFRKISVVEMSILILLGQWDRLAEFYVDYSGSLSKEEIVKMLRERAQRKEISYEEYASYLSNPTPESRKYLSSCIEKKYGGTGASTIDYNRDD